MATTRESILRKPDGSCHYCGFMSICNTHAHNELKHSLLSTRTRCLQRNEALCVLNNKFHSIHIIKKGAVKAYQVDINGYEHIHAFYFTGEALGFRAIHAGHYISNVVALTDTIVCEVPYSHFVESLKTNPELSASFFSLISKQLTASTYIDISPAKKRLAAFILDLSLRTDNAIPLQQLTLPMSRQDIGNYLRLTAETVSRLLSQLQKEKIIKTERKLIKIINLPRLHELTQ